MGSPICFFIHSCSPAIVGAPLRDNVPRCVVTKPGERLATQPSDSAETPRGQGVLSPRKILSTSGRGLSSLSVTLLSVVEGPLRVTAFGVKRTWSFGKIRFRGRYRG
jgi:hypothetical protein